jgi:hypothetical protein
MIGIWGSFAFLTIFVAVSVNAEEDYVRAKLGIMIKSATKTVRAKKKDRIRMGDRVRIYALPEKPSYVFIIHSDTKTATLLNTDSQRVDKTVLMLPSPQNYYEMDGQSAKEFITIVCSPDELPAVSDLFKSEQAPHAKWAALEKELIEKSRIDLTHKAEKPFAVAGNVRGDAIAADPFVEKLQTVSGKSFVTRRYEFRVKK